MKYEIWTHLARGQSNKWDDHQNWRNITSIHLREYDTIGHKRRYDARFETTGGHKTLSREFLSPAIIKSIVDESSIERRTRRREKDQANPETCWWVAFSWKNRRLICCYSRRTEKEEYQRFSLKMIRYGSSQIDVKMLIKESICACVLRNSRLIIELLEKS